MSTVTLIVLNWNGRFLLQSCLAALKNLDYPAFKIIFVDNASTDDSVAYVQAHFPEVIIQQNEENRGFAAGNNVALRQLESDFAVLINPDIVVPRDWLQQLIPPLLSDPTIGIAGCKLLYPDRKTLQHAGGVITPPLAFPKHLGTREPDQGQYESFCDVDYVIGAAMAVRRTVLDDIGLLDEGYFLYFEDADYCHRARRSGLRVVYVPQATAVHDESAIAGQGSPTYLRRFHSSRWRYLLKHYPAEMLLGQTMAAEKVWLAACDPAERQAAAQAYRATLVALPEIQQARERDGAEAITAADAQTIAQQITQLWHSARQQPDTTTWTILAQKAFVEERPFQSTTPLLGLLLVQLRTIWNNIAARWVVRPLTAQQNEFNQQLLQELRLAANRLQNEADTVLAVDADQSHVQQMQQELQIELTQMMQQINHLEQRLQQLEET